ncbi:MAG: alpha/beta fold hydrolase [Dissulfuribacterales bacterium]
MYHQRIDDIAFVAGRWPLDPNLETVVFIHGAGGTNLLWHHQVEALADSMNTIALDLPGHGNSKGKAMERVEDYARSVSTFIQSIGVTRPAICGLSMGGAIVLQLLIGEQDNYRAGIAANTGAKLKTQPFIFDMIENDYKGFVHGMYTFGISNKTNPSKLKPLVDSMEECPPGVVKGDFLACNDFNVMDKLHEIRVPVLVLTASDDQLTPVKFGKYLAEQISGAAISNIEDAGHLSPIEKPEEVSQAIRGFLEQ